VPTRKQRRRQQKSRRHEWEYVYVDDEGNEVEVDEDEVAAPKQQDKPRKDAAARRNGKAPDAGRRPRRAPQPPSWRRAAKRAAFLGIFFVVVFGFILRGKNTNPAAAVAIGLLYTAAFIPIQYFIDRLTYRTYLRRQASTKTR
jgi:hypothetical protein